MRQIELITTITAEITLFSISRIGLRRVKKRSATIAPVEFAKIRVTRNLDDQRATRCSFSTYSNIRTDIIQ